MAQHPATTDGPNPGASPTSTMPASTSTGPGNVDTQAGHSSGTTSSGTTSSGTSTGSTTSGTTTSGTTTSGTTTSGTTTSGTTTSGTTTSGTTTSGTTTGGTTTGGSTTSGTTTGATGPQVNDISTGLTGDNTCVVIDNGNIKCWGVNTDGQLGLGDATSRGSNANQMGQSLPYVNVGTGRTVVAFDATAAVCTVLDNGGLTCWGDNPNGQLGLGDTNNRGFSAATLPSTLSPLNLGSGRSAVSVSTGPASTCVVLDNGGVECWGDNGAGELGLGDSNARLTPTQTTTNLGTGRTALSVSAGPLGTCAVLDDGQLKCWGENSVGELGLGDTTTRGVNSNQLGNSLPAVSVGTGRTVQSVSMGGSGTLTTQYNCFYGGTYATYAACFVVCGICTAATSVTDSSFTCALLDDGSVKSWGVNNNGQLGLGDTATRGTSTTQMGNNLPNVSLGTGRTAVEVKAGVNHACARLDDGSVKCWGNNSVGQLGLGDTTTRGTSGAQMGDSLPAVNLGVGRTATALSVGNQRTCVLLDNHAVKCWGLNTSGQLGIGDTTNRGTSAAQMSSLPSPVL